MQIETAAAVDCFGDPLPAGAQLRLGTVRLRSGHSVAGVAFSPDSNIVVSTGWDESIRFWDVDTGRLVRRLVIDDIDVATFAAAFSPDGAKLVSVGDRGYVRLWDVHSGRLLSKVLGHADRTFGARVDSVAFSPDGVSFATAGEDNSIILWDAATGDKLLTLQSEERGSGSRPVAFSPDGSLLASGDAKGTIQIWNLSEGEEPRAIPQAHQRDVSALAFTKDGKHLISSGVHFERTGERSVRSISEIHVWSVISGEKQKGFSAEEDLEGDCTFALSNDGQFLASAHYEKVVIWDVNERAPIRIIPGETEYYGGRSNNIAISPDNKLVAAGTSGAGTNKVYLWNLATGEAVLPQADTHVEAVLAMDLAPDGSTIVTGSADGTVRLWNAKSGEHVRLIDKGSGWVRYVQFLPDGQSIALGRETHSRERPKFEGEVKVCLVADGSVVNHWTVPDRVMCGALSSKDGAKIAVGIGLGEPFRMGPGEDTSECKILVWDLQSGKKVSEFTGPRSEYQHLLFADSGSEVWSTSQDQVVRKWDTKSSEETESHNMSADGPRSFRWSLIIPDTSRLLLRGLDRVDRTVSRGKLAVTDFENKEIAWEKIFPDTWPRQCAVSDDGALVAAFLFPLSGTKGTKQITIFSADDGRELLSFALDDGNVRSMAFSPDGNTLMTGMEASDALVWDISTVRHSLTESGQ